MYQNLCASWPKPLAGSVMKVICSDGTRFRRLLLVIVGAGAVLLAGCSSGGASSSPASGSSPQAAGRSYNLPSSVKTLEVSNQGTTQITAMQNSSQISVVERPTGDVTSGHNVAGYTGTVSSHCPGGINIRDCHMDYQITMPPSVALNVRGVGLVRLRGGPAKAQIQTDAGEVSGTGLGHGSYTVTTQAGRVKLTFTSAPTLVKVTTSAGTIDVTVPGNASYRVNASSEMGDKDVTVPSDATATNVIDLHAEVGIVSLHKV